MMDRVVVERNTYHDSVLLMLLSEELRQAPGVLEVAVLSATPVNVNLLRDRGFDILADVGPNDLLIAVRADDARVVDDLVQQVEGRLTQHTSPDATNTLTPPPASVMSAAKRNDEINVAAVAVPNGYATYEVASALEAGLHVFCFSSGVELKDEAALKRRAAELGLLVMGPDCGTALINGVPYGFVNAVRAGPVGLVAASGTGAQQIMCLLDAAGVGISHVIGVGSNDLHADVGGLMAFEALNLLSSDPRTQVIAIISKPPAPAVTAELRKRVATVGKPCVLMFLGEKPPFQEKEQGQVGTIARSLEHAAIQLSTLAGGTLVLADMRPPSLTLGSIRGLFCGGSLCHEAMMVVSGAAATRSNLAFDSPLDLLHLREVKGHAFFDFGEESLTHGRAHPMIDPGLRNSVFLEQAALPDVGVVLLDVILGYGAHADPAGELAPLVGRAIDSRAGSCTVIVTVVGTAADPQGIAGQVSRLREAGALVTSSVSQAARVALVAAGYP